MPIEVRRTEEFIEWLNKLRDRKARAIIIRRIDRLVETGNFGDAQPVGSGVTEMRIHYGPGYRIYCVQPGRAIVIILCGGDKSEQQRDIERAKILAADLQKG
jgi:putative addiction module killer protein